jgi:hypothetical protein
MESLLNSQKQNILNLIKLHRAYLEKEFAVERIGVFGSTIKGLSNETSDIDIIVKLKQPLGYKFNDLVEYLETLFQRKVDVLTEDGLNAIRIKDISDDIKRTIAYV